jgi:hypothetical protein
MNELEVDIEAIARFKSKLVAWAAKAAPDEDARLVALALFNLSQKVLIQALGDRDAARAFLRRSFDNGDGDMTH